MKQATPEALGTMPVLSIFQEAINKRIRSIIDSEHMEVYTDPTDL